MIIIKKFFFHRMFLACWILSSCSLQQVIKKAENQEISVIPSALEQQGDSVKFTLQVWLPSYMLEKNLTYTLIPEFRYGNQSHNFMKVVAFDGDTLKRNFPLEKKMDFSFPFYEQMKRGELVVYGIAANKKSGKYLSTPAESVSKGVSTTSSLTQIGHFDTEENIPKIGKYLKMDEEQSYGTFSHGFSDLGDKILSENRISLQEKDELLAILAGRGDFSYKDHQLKTLTNYKKVKEDIYPLLRIGKKQEEENQDTLSEIEISIKSYQIRKGLASGKELSEVELAFAASEEPGFNEKTHLYFAMVDAYPSVFSYNNLGVSLLNLAFRTHESSKKNDHLLNAIKAFDHANDISENPVVTYNLALAYLMGGDRLEAYNTFYRAMVLTRDNDLVKMNEASLGAISILNGDYKLAALHFEKAAETEINLFNRGLAFFLAQEYEQALISFEDSAILNLENGFPFYGIALIAARTGDEPMLFENIKKAIQKNEFLRKRATSDQEFVIYHSNEEFRDAVR